MMLLQINTRPFLTELAGGRIGELTLDAITEEHCSEWAKAGFTWIWFLSVWQTGEAARTISRENPDWVDEYQHTLSDLTTEDIQGSGFAITEYCVHAALGGNGALERLRARMSRFGLKLMLDFVPNHMAPDHDWIDSFPNWFIQGDEFLLSREPLNYFRHPSGRVFARGRDPYFPGWPDTIQLDYSNGELVRKMQSLLVAVSSLCDGVRCDMAMLVLPDVFERTWGRPALPFWKEAIEQCKALNQDFTFLAEVYWDREWELQQIGFDYCYDKRLYDRLRHERGLGVRAHLVADLSYQRKLARFLENHDEARINSEMPHHQHFAAAVITYLTPGLKFFHDGQITGSKVKLSPHLVRRPLESWDEPVQAFYESLMKVVRSKMIREGSWLLLETRPAWDGNDSEKNVVVFRWKDEDHRQLIVAVNYSEYPAQARFRLAMDRNCISDVLFRDALSGITIQRHRGEIFSPGMLLDFAPWQCYVLLEVDD